MPLSYEPKDHILHLELAPRAESVLDQREITVHAYQTSVPFDYDALNARLDRAWLTPTTRFGVFAPTPGTHKDQIHVVLGLQGNLSVRAYDYDERRPLWFSWQDVIVDTMSICYIRDESGLIRFTTAGGGARITNEKLEDFNSGFLKIPKEAVRRREFDLAKLRDLCFKRFADYLYMIRFSHLAATEYRSIDHALFQSRRYIDPAADRFQEVQANAKVMIESFESDVNIRTDDLASPIEVRFAIRGQSGSLWLRFPKITYSVQNKTGEEQTRVFYRLVDETVKSILDADYYALRALSLAQLDLNSDIPEFADTTPYREVLGIPEARKEFFLGLDLGLPNHKWLPHLRAVDELLPAIIVRSHVVELATELAKRDPGQAVRLLSVCSTDARLSRLGEVTFDVLRAELQGMPAEMRGHTEETLLAWVIDHEVDGWDVDPESGDISVRKLRWRLEDLALEVIPKVLWKLAGVLHARLNASSGDVHADLCKYDWCMKAAKMLPANHSASPAALRLVAAGRVPHSVREGARVLEEPVPDLRAMDDALLNQFGLPLWPHLAAASADGNIVLSNDGVGSALAIAVGPSKTLFSDDSTSPRFDLAAGQSITLPLPGSQTTCPLAFEKFGKRHHAIVTVVAGLSAAAVQPNIRTLTLSINRKSISAQRAYRAEIDRAGVVVGSSPAILKIFEDIHYANAMHDGAGAAVLILGETGVGKTHIAKLLHDSSTRASRVFKEVGAGSSGGDLTIQRGEWIGYAKGHGISGVDPKGKAGHLVDVDGGTLFVDEFSALSQELQVIFLAVLEQRDVTKVGGESFEPNVRCIFATNADVDDLAKQRLLRRELLARIRVRICIPPLRERRGDILMLAKHFLAKHFPGVDHPLSEKCLLTLVRYDWPDNVRELESAIVKACTRKQMAGASSVDVAHLQDIPMAVIEAVQAAPDDDCRRELWQMADGIARDEGFTHGAGLQRRAGEIMGVGEPQATRMYREFGMGDPAAA